MPARATLVPIGQKGSNLRTEGSLKIRQIATSQVDLVADHRSRSPAGSRKIQIPRSSRAQVGGQTLAEEPDHVGRRGRDLRLEWTGGSAVGDQLKISTRKGTLP